MKPTDRVTLALAAIIVAFLLLASALTAQAQSCVTPSDDAEYCLVPDATLTPLPTITILPWQSPTPTIAPTLTPVDYYQCATAIARGCALLPIASK